MTSGLDALHPALRYHIVSSLGWTDLRSTQNEAAGPIVAGEDVLLLAPTAGGKTEAAVFPLLSRIASERWHGLSVLYLCPLKALLNNLAPRLERYAGFTGLRCGLWHGDVGEAGRRRMLRDPPEMLLTTPESLEAMLISPRLDHSRFLGGVRAVIVDELHAFAGDDRGWHLLFLLSRLEQLGNHRIQRVGMTATVGNPDDMLAWLNRGRAGRVIGPAKPVVHGDVTADHVGSLDGAITVISRLYRGERRLVFADSRARVEAIAAGLHAEGVRTFVSHAALSLNERQRAETAFSVEPDCVIVATSTLELGLDVGDLDRVIQVGAPPSVASFLQRMGRTGRRPDTLRNCLLLATSDEELLASLAIVSLWRDGRVEPVIAPARPAHIFAQQVMALLLQETGIATADLSQWLGDVWTCVPEGDRDAVLIHMLLAGVLAEDGGVIGLGPRGEAEFGRRYFGDLVAAFSEPLLFAVRHGTSQLGQVHAVSIGPVRNGGPAVLSLGGRAWRVTTIDWRRRTVAVTPTEERGRSRWLGGSRPMGAPTAAAAERLIAGGIPGCRLSRRAETALAAIRERLPFVDCKTLPVVGDDGGDVRLWGFSGGAAHATVAAALSRSGISVTSSDGFSITLRNCEAARVRDTFLALDPVKIGPSLPDDLASALKFGACLPDPTIKAVLQMRLGDPRSVIALHDRKPRLVRDTASASWSAMN